MNSIKLTNKCNILYFPDDRTLIYQSDIYFIFQSTFLIHFDTDLVVHPLPQLSWEVSSKIRRRVLKYLAAASTLIYW